MRRRKPEKGSDLDYNYQMSKRREATFWSALIFQASLENDQEIVRMRFRTAEGVNHSDLKEFPVIHLSQLMAIEE